ncbi:VOC family protein [Vineibacter terrae]|uniref:VOC family protein n=1 Tax=Vineibacter terrae TaxID=2586908 RepID=UPI002E356DE0|nr:VOC family protein [Vineibacter terrae]HEX2886965.1 VOC family protein [Vineibacter terrae]
MRGAIHHLDLTVKDPWASRAFYEAVLGLMGYRCVKEDERGFDWDLVTPDGSSSCSIGIVKAEGDRRTRPHDRYAPGLHHVAWRADSRADVDQLYAHLMDLGATILDPPAEYPQYGPGYYAVFFTDPDGLKLEYVHTP